MTRILGKERELRAVLKHSEEKADPAIIELLDAIERETPNFRLMVSNIQVLVQLEAPIGVTRLEPVEPAEVVRRIVGRYASVANEAQKEITWWSEPAEIGIVYSESSAIEHITTSLIDNAVRFAYRHIGSQANPQSDPSVHSRSGRWPRHISSVSPPYLRPRLGRLRS